MAKAAKSAVKEIFDDQNAGRLDFFHARTLAYSVAGEMDKLKTLVEELETQRQSVKSAEARTRITLTLGVGLWILRRYAEAAEALAHLRSHLDGAFFLGLCLTETGAYDKAVASLQQASKHGQDEFVCAMAVAEAARRAGNPEESLAQIRKHQEEYAGEAELHYQKGRCLEEDVDYSAAMDAYERAVELNPQHAAALFRLAYWHDLRGNDDLALDYYEKAAQIPPVRANVLLNLGVLYEDHANYEKARAVYARVLAAQPCHPRARAFLKDAEAGLSMYYDEATERQQHRTAALLKTPLSDFELSARSRSCLDKMNLRILGDLTRLTEDELVHSKNFGETSLDELRQLLKSKGLHFGFGREEAAAAATEALAPPTHAGALARPISDLDLSIRSQKCMQAIGVQTIGDLIEKSDRNLLQCQNFGQTSLQEVKDKLSDLELSLKPAK